MLTSNLIAHPGKILAPEIVLAALHKSLDELFRKQKLLILIPDHTRSLPLPFLFRSLVEILGDANKLDFMVALGTHPPLRESDLCELVGITPEERKTT